LVHGNAKIATIRIMPTQMAAMKKRENEIKQNLPPAPGVCGLSFGSLLGAGLSWY
jgi:hypothetical protein